MNKAGFIQHLTIGFYILLTDFVCGIIISGAFEKSSRTLKIYVMCVSKLHSSLRKLQGEWVQAFGAMIPGIGSVHKLLLVIG